MGTLLSRDLRGMTLSKMLTSASLQLTNVFLALLLLGKGLKMWQIAGFYLIYSLIGLTIIRLCCRAINSNGVRFGFIAFSVAGAAYMIVFAVYVAGAPNWTIIILAALFAAFVSFREPVQAVHFSRAMDGTRKGRDVARIGILVEGVGWLTPLSGGMVAAAHGQIWLGIVAACLALLAIVPVWHSDRLGGGHQPEPMNSYRHHAPWRELAASFGWNFQAGVGFWAWWIYLAVAIPSFRVLGAAASVSSIVASALMALAGRWIDRHRQGMRIVLVTTVCLTSVVHLARILVVMILPRSVTVSLAATLVMTLATTAYGVALSLLGIGWQASYYSRAREGINYIASMGESGGVANVVLWGGLCALAYFGQSLSGVFIAAFAGAGVITWCCLLILPRGERRDPDQVAPLPVEVTE